MTHHLPHHLPTPLALRSCPLRLFSLLTLSTSPLTLLLPLRPASLSNLTFLPGFSASHVAAKSSTIRLHGNSPFTSKCWTQGDILSGMNQSNGPFPMMLTKFSQLPRSHGWSNGWVWMTMYSRPSSRVNSRMTFGVVPLLYRMDDLPGGLCGGLFDRATCMAMFWIPPLWTVSTVV